MPAGVPRTALLPFRAAFPSVKMSEFVTFSKEYVEDLLAVRLHLGSAGVPRCNNGRFSSMAPQPPPQSGLGREILFDATMCRKFFLEYYFVVGLRPMLA